VVGESEVKLIRSGQENISTGVHLETSSYTNSQSPFSMKVIVGLILILSISVVVVYLGIMQESSGNNESNHNMYWYVKIGDKLIFNVTYTNTTPFDDTWTKYGMYEFDCVQVVFEVNTLPAIPEIVSSDIFIEDVVVLPKVDCYFLNGSLLQSSYSSYLNTLVSCCLLPVNGSLVLDGLFPDFDSNSYPEGYNYYFENVNSEYMFIGHKSFNHYQSGHGCWGTEWYGEVSHETGIPNNLVLKNYVPYSTGCNDDEIITLRLIDYDSL
jgi:hypothetical protein